MATSQAEVDRLVARAVEDAYGNGRPDVATFTADPTGQYGYRATSSVDKDIYIFSSENQYKTAGDMYKYGRSQHPKPLTRMEKFASWSRSLESNDDGPNTAAAWPFYNRDGTLGRGGQLFVGTIGVAGGVMTLPYAGAGLGARLLWGAGMASDLNGMEQALSNRQQSLGETAAESLGGKTGKKVFYGADVIVNAAGIRSAYKSIRMNGPWLSKMPTDKAISSFSWAPDVQSTIDQVVKPFGFNFNWRDFKLIPAQNSTATPAPTPKKP